MRETAVPAHFTARTLRDGTPTCGMVASVRCSGKTGVPMATSTVLMKEITRVAREQRDQIAAFGARTSWPAGFTIYEQGAAAGRHFSGASGTGGAAESGGGGAQLRAVGGDAGRDVWRRGAGGLRCVREPGARRRGERDAASQLRAIQRNVARATRHCADTVAADHGRTDGAAREVRPARDAHGGAAADRIAREARAEPRYARGRAPYRRYRADFSVSWLARRGNRSRSCSDGSARRGSCGARVADCSSPISTSSLMRLAPATRPPLGGFRRQRSGKRRIFGRRRSARVPSGARFTDGAARLAFSRDCFRSCRHRPSACLRRESGCEASIA